jgi:hypothetical protein
MFSLVAAGRVFDDPGADAWHALDKRLRDIEANWRLLRPLLLAQLDAQVDVA